MQDEHELNHNVTRNLHALLFNEATLLEDSDRSNVVLHYVSVERTSCHLVQESGERPSRNALAPVFLADPIADQAKTFLSPAPYVACDLVIEENRLSNGVRVTEDVLLPMGIEGFAVTRRKCSHASGVGVELLLVEDRQIV